MCTGNASLSWYCFMWECSDSHKSPYRQTQQVLQVSQVWFTEGVFVCVEKDTEKNPVLSYIQSRCTANTCQYKINKHICRYSLQAFGSKTTKQKDMIDVCIYWRLLGLSLGLLVYLNVNPCIPFHPLSIWHTASKWSIFTYSKRFLYRQIQTDLKQSDNKQMILS